MKRAHLPLVLALFAALLTMFVVHADAPHAVNLPVVLGQPVASICDDSAPLLDQDTGLLSAGRTSDGKYIIAYQDRAHGSRAHIVEHIGDRLVEVTEPTSHAIAPAFSPDGVKQGALALVMGGPGEKNRLYFTQRKPGDTTGPYGVWCQEF